MGDFASLGMGMKLAIILGCLIAVTFIAGGIKVFLNRRRMDRKRQEEARRPADKEKLVQKEFNEGNLFGVRAIQHGFYGGVAQRPSSPSPSYLLAPDASVVDWSKESKAGSSASSVSSFPQSVKPSRMKSSPLRLEVQDPKFNPSSVGGMGGSYLPPLPSPRQNRCESPMFCEPKPTGWVSPLDVHFSRPSTPQTYRPTSYLPRLNLDFGNSGMLMPASTEAQSEVASIVSSEVAAPAPAVLKSPVQSIFAPQLSTVRAAQKSLRSIFPAEGQNQLGSPKGNYFDSPPVPLKDLSPKLPTLVDHNNFPQDNRQWNPVSPVLTRELAKGGQWKPTPTVGVAVPPPTDRWAIGAAASPTLGEAWRPASPTIPDSVLDAEWDRSRPIIRDSKVSIQRVSVIRPARASQIESIATRDQRRSFRNVHRDSVAASSLYSNESSILDIGNRGKHERIHSHVAAFDFSHDRSHSGTTKPSSPPESLIRMSRSQSLSKPRDGTHESPFSNSHATSDNSHSASSSFSSYLSTKENPELPTLPSNIVKSQSSLPDLENFPFPASTQPPLPRGFEFGLPADRLKLSPNLRGRSNSEASQASIGEFYDSYYRQSGLQPSQAGGRNSIHAQIQGFSSRPGANVELRSPPKRPAPLNLSKLGPKYAGDETLVEVVTPNTGAFGPVDIERFPLRI